MLVLLLLASPACAQQTQTGIASWYGVGFAGNRTSNGEIFDPKALTAAHNSLPFGTHVRVVNLKTRKSVIVKINDRGDFSVKYHRLIDLSRHAAEVLNMLEIGIAFVRVEVLSTPSVKQQRRSFYGH
jgi:rare lipoprotein A